jgi:serine/threonine protein kinase
MEPERESLSPEQSQDHQIPLSPTGPFLPTEDGAGARIGPYKLLQQIGEGGFGIVYMAEQDQPVHRRVALKIIKPGMDSSQVIARFEAERQALALMDHQNIAKVFDAGTTQTGRPFFVMELVHGIPLTRFCDDNHQSVRERLELFVPVCKAVQHAHQKGIIHRDLKPSNVLVCLYDGQPVPKIIDFGVAKATEQKLTERTMFTQYGQIIGTLEYMSPEQAEMSQLGVDTRSDIYSLGVMLYELLTGSTPLERQRLREAGLSEMLKMVKEEEPPRPSTRLSSTQQAGKVAAARRTEPGMLAQLLRGELDWIVMKCLEKDRARRYETANSLARELERYLHDEPVEACPPSTTYRLRKLARKHRAALNLAGVFLALLVIAAAVSVWQAVRARAAERQALAERDRAEQERERAERERDRAEAGFRMARDTVDRFFTQVAESPKLQAQGMEKFRKELLQNAKEFYERFTKEQPDTPSARHDLGQAHRRLAEILVTMGDYAAALAVSYKGLEILGDLARAHPAEVSYRQELVRCYVELCRAHNNSGDLEKAESALKQALVIEEKLAEEHPEDEEFKYGLANILLFLGITHGNAERWESARLPLERALRIWMNLTKDHPDQSRFQAKLADTQCTLGGNYLALGWSDKAEAFLREAEASYLAIVRLNPANPTYREKLGRNLLVLGDLYRNNLGSVEKAETAHQQALQILEKLTAEHPDVVVCAMDLGQAYLTLGRDAQMAGRMDVALVRCDKAIEILKGAMDRGNGLARWDLLDAQINRASLRSDRGDYKQAVDDVEALARQGDLISSNLYGVACVFSRSVAAVEKDAKLSSADRKRLKTQYADRAMEFLRQAFAKGERNVAHWKTDPGLNSLRSREDFQKLVRELEQNTKNH